MTSKKKSDSPSPRTKAVELTPLKRKRLLARVSGDIAAGIMQSPSPSADTPEAVAEISVDMAEAILEKIGL